MVTSMLLLYFLQKTSFNKSDLYIEKISYLVVQ
jgi:hypothetical protein